jgi:hypothetical protein
MFFSTLLKEVVKIQIAQKARSKKFLQFNVKSDRTLCGATNSSPFEPFARNKFYLSWLVCSMGCWYPFVDLPESKMHI